ncbi:hypothetical protein N1030_12255 [Desulfovibrio mangrovi]|uniref:hypothetical protein n=1 Tax=Desulfovibrio mangrovi TaxID=2976983 RepID=UPI002245ADEC|nr:hypothetical protein [Desulfovibrio mangrovi]UZP66378.1 hypothetical protein N1030_12255 [Desulfovibrio mangrovi]
MAPAVITIAESLRPWRNAGLEFVLDEHGLFAAGSVSDAAEQQAQGPVANQVFSQAGSGQGVSPQSRQSYPPQAARPQQAQPSHAQAYAARQKAAQNQPMQGQAPTQAPSQAHGAQPAGNVRAMGTSGLAVHPTSQPPEQWPAPWQAVWGKVKAPSAVVWTYWSLGDDLSGRANAERGALLRKIIGSLQLPAGSSAFWPVALPEVAPESGTDAGSELIAAPEIFLAGLRRARPRYCITFGSKALRTFAPNLGLAPYTFTQFLGHRLIALPDIDILLKNQGTVPAVIAFLKTAVTLRG